MMSATCCLPKIYTQVAGPAPGGQYLSKDHPAQLPLPLVLGSYWEGNRQEGEGSPNGGNMLQVSDIFYLSLKWQGDAEAKTPVLWPLHAESWLIGNDPDAGRDWGQEEEGTTEDEMAGWHHQLNGHEFE